MARLTKAQIKEFTTDNKYFPNWENQEKAGARKAKLMIQDELKSSMKELENKWDATKNPFERNRIHSDIMQCEKHMMEALEISDEEAIEIRQELTGFQFPCCLPVYSDSLTFNRHIHGQYEEFLTEALPMTKALSEAEDKVFGLINENMHFNKLGVKTSQLQLDRTQEAINQRDELKNQFINLLEKHTPKKLSRTVEMNIYKHFMRILGLTKDKI